MSNQNDPLRFVETKADGHAREALIAQLAYGRAESRGFEPGHELDDWLAAEKEVDSSPTKKQQPPDDHAVDDSPSRGRSKRPTPKDLGQKTPETGYAATEGL